jgi:hypothetical protein
MLQKNRRIIESFGSTTHFSKILPKKSVYVTSLKIALKFKSHIAKETAYLIIGFFNFLF